ncbi:MAG: hypothetical protein QOE96_2998 [Blastocatellia bacterium]|nr:hypothetical protein [Blastocatellia bacterium]
MPAAEKRKQFELRALGLREFAGVNGDQPLDPFALASFARLLVVDFNTIEGLSPESRTHLLGAAVDQWSGGACSRPLPNGWRLVILNPAHGIQRNRATLMEEVAHVFLGHKPSRLAAITSDAGPNQLSAAATQSTGRMLARDYNQLDEEAAYSVGAAALVPFAGLRRRVMEGRSSREIARHFRVSRQLVEYRIKVTHLWPEYKRLSATRPEHV